MIHLLKIRVQLLFQYKKMTQDRFLQIFLYSNLYSSCFYWAVRAKAVFYDKRDWHIRVESDCDPVCIHFWYVLDVKK